MRFENVIPCKRMDVGSRSFSENIIIYNQTNDQMWLFNNSTREIWDLIDGEMSVKDIAIKISSKYDVGYTTIRNDIEQIIHIFHHLSLINLANARLEKLYELDGSSLEYDSNVVMFFAKRNNFIVNPLIELLYDCNLSCQHCYIDHVPENKLTYNEVIDLLDQFAVTGTPQVTFSGGEIFLRSDIISIIKSAVSKGFAVNLLSNGTLVDQKHIDALQDIPINMIKISFYGATEEVHDKVTGVANSFRDSFQTVKKLKEIGKPLLFNYIIMKENFHQVPAMREIARQLDCGAVFDFRMLPKRSGDEGPKDFYVSEEQLAYLFKENLVPPIKPTVCFAGLTKAVIDPSGNVMPCEYLMNYSLGNIRESSLADIWNGEKVKEFRAQVEQYNPAECSDCVHRNRCLKCPAIVWEKQLFKNEVDKKLTCEQTFLYNRVINQDRR